VPPWKNPFVLAFVAGAAFLTVLPVLQRPFLKAPPPVMALGPWALESLGGGPVSSEALAGKVVLATTEWGPCDAACVTRQEAFGRGVNHVDDLGDRIVFVSLVGPEAKAPLARLWQGASPAWRFGAATPEFLGELERGLRQFTGRPGATFAEAHAIVLIDQDNAVRGYWFDDVAGRGNSINAARLLAKHGPNP
jgi:cytochrome oxidase Cu insertion factor (SCO1/SenC/PrrC family)